MSLPLFLAIKAKPLTKFKVIEILPAICEHQLNDVYVMKKMRKQSIWYTKLLGTCEAASSFFAGEFARLLGNSANVPYPKNRVISGEDESVVESGGKEVYIASKKIVGFEEMNEQKLHELATNPSKYAGFGVAVMVKYILEDLDDKLPNLADTDGQIVAIDFDCCLSELSLPETIEELGLKLDEVSRVSSEDIESLPRLSSNGFTPYNWLSMKMKGKLWTNSDFAYGDKSAANSDLVAIGLDPKFRREVNNTLLNLILLPKELLSRFLNSYIDPRALEWDQLCVADLLLDKQIKDILNFFDKRPDKFKAAALGSEKFTTYLFAPNSREDLNAMINEILSFKTISNIPLVPPDQRQIIANQIRANYENLILQVLENRLKTYRKKIIPLTSTSSPRIFDEKARNEKVEEIKIVDIFLSNLKQLFKGEAKPQELLSLSQLQVLQNQDELGKIFSDFSFSKEAQSCCH